MAFIRNCYVSAPAGLDISKLGRILNSKGVQIVGAERMPSFSGLDTSTQAITSADLVIGVLTRERDSQWVLFELGQAHALGKRILIVAYPSAGSIPSQFRKLLIVRSNLSDLQAVEFALDQVLAAPDKTNREPNDQTSFERPVDYQAIAHLRETKSSGYLGHREVEELVAQALRAGGAEVVVESGTPDHGADLAVWSDLWSPTIANPLLVEIKTSVRGRAQAERVASQVQHYLQRAGTGIGLLVVVKGADEFSRLPKSKMKQLLVLSLEELIDGIQNTGLQETILGALTKKRVG
jgi:hypothetical protein